MAVSVHGLTYDTPEQVLKQIGILEGINEVIGESDGRVTEVNALKAVFTIRFPSGEMMGVYDTQWEAEDAYWPSAAARRSLVLPTVMSIRWITQGLKSSGTQIGLTMKVSI